jgi:hypothetical protein
MLSSVIFYPEIKTYEHFEDHMLRNSRTYSKHEIRDINLPNANFGFATMNAQRRITLLDLTYSRSVVSCKNMLSLVSIWLSFSSLSFSLRKDAVVCVLFAIIFVNLSRFLILIFLTSVQTLILMNDLQWWYIIAGEFLAHGTISTNIP